MRNYADELLTMVAVWTEPRIRRSQSSTDTRACRQPVESKQAVRPVVRARWILVDGTLQLIWSEAHEEPLRCAA